MIDYNVVETERAINDDINMSEDMCLLSAIAHGITQDQADNCDDGDQGCPTCPWRIKGEIDGEDNQG